MRQRRIAAPEQAISYTAFVLDETGAVVDLSAATLVAKVRSPMGTTKSLTASGNSSGALMISGTLDAETGEHQIAATVDGVIMHRRSFSAIGSPFDQASGDWA